jgi:serine/threonine protein kinase
MDFPYLTVIAGPDKGRNFPIHPGTGNLLGRKEDNAYVLKDQRVSRHHCELVSENSQVKVIDRGGSGGTMVNGYKVSEHVLRHGDTIQVGETMIRYLTRPDAGGTTVGPGVASGNAEYDPQAVEQLAELSGRMLKQFEIGEPLGTGSTSMVFRATDTESGKVAALKVMQPAYGKNDEEVQRFVRAMRTMMPHKHPNIVTVYAAGKNGPYCWCALELVEGESLTEVIKRIGVAGMLDWKYAFRVGAQIGRALEYAREHNIIHRDVSPANILMSTDKTAKLSDLMLAKAVEGSLAQQVTKPGEIVGDVNYMAPERTRGPGESVDHRADLFGLGATCYALLAGKPPFAGSSLVETITKIRTAEPLKPSTFQLGIPSAFEGVVLKLLAKRPDDRFQTAGEVVRELEKIGKFNGVQA